LTGFPAKSAMKEVSIPKNVFARATPILPVPKDPSAVTSARPSWRVRKVLSAGRRFESRSVAPLSGSG